MSIADDMRKNAELASFNRLLVEIENASNHCKTELNLNDFDYLNLPDDYEDKLKDKGFDVDGNIIRW